MCIRYCQLVHVVSPFSHRAHCVCVHNFIAGVYGRQNALHYCIKVSGVRVGGDVVKDDRYVLHRYKYG